MSINLTNDVYYEKERKKKVKLTKKMLMTMR